MSDLQPLDRRGALGLIAGAAGVLAVPHSARAQPPQPPTQPATAARSVTTGRLKQSVCRWCYGNVPLEELCKAAAEMGLTSVELLNPDEWPVTRRHGLACAVANSVKSNPIHSGFNRVENHDAIVRQLEERLPLVQAAGIPNQICFSGNRAGLDDREGLKNCAIGLKRITPLAEKAGVVIIMELLNSRHDHKDYMCDRTEWGVNLVNEVGSPSFKLLYDIYHMQIMEGDVIQTVLDNWDAIAHFHTAGVPGRRDLDDTQELNYRGICAALISKNYQGYFGQEFIPKDGLNSLRAAAALCDL